MEQSQRLNKSDRERLNMEKINITLATGAIMPTRGTDGAAGYDLYAIEDVTINCFQFIPVSTRVSAQCHGTRYYVGSPCKHHPLNNIRSTSNKTCVVCELLKDYL